MHRKELFISRSEKEWGLYTKKKLEQGAFIAFYTGTWYPLYSKKGNKYSVNVRDFALVPRIKNPRLHFAAMANEPSVGESVNSTLLEIEYDGGEFNETSDTKYLCVALFAVRNIKENEEILWYYGENYDRNYKLGDVHHVPLKMCEDPRSFVAMDQISRVLIA